MRRRAAAPGGMGGQVRSAEMQDGHVVKTPGTALRMATERENSGDSGTASSQRETLVPGEGRQRGGAVNDHRAGHFELLDLISGLRGRTGMTTVLTTHYLDEAERLCDRIAVMHQDAFLFPVTTAPEH